VARTRADQLVVDLVRLPGGQERVKGEYEGICW